ncbi:MAG: hypothetical protein WD767_12330 [Alphaproteobacteria bacterium]
MAAKADMAEPMADDNGKHDAQDERRRRQRSRNLTLLLVLGGLALLFYVITIVRMGGG